jgi:UDP-GlcNAc:undecaprenyl-phosphate/decaprenyl-phosphate GlcNAc-1-phosphate transferase
LGIDYFFQIVLISLTPLIIVGIIDDLKGVSIPIRLVVQILSSWIVILFTDVYIRDLGDLFGLGVIDLKEFGIPFTIFCVVGICNAFNMLDGKDGLTGSVSLLVFSGLMILLSLKGYNYQLGMILIPTLLVFLAFNMSIFGVSRKIFLGDHGALGLGHLIAWNLIYFSQEITVVTPVSALWLVFYPLTDTIVTFIRRLRSDRSIFRPDRHHLHFILTDYGLSDLKVYSLVILISIVGALFAIISNILLFSEYLVFYLYLTALLFFFLLTKEKR